MNFKKKIFSILFGSGFFLLLASLIYDLITSLRNFLYDKKIFSSINFKIPIISVGNISLGGTGKTPLVEYLANYYLCLLYTSPSPRDGLLSRMPSSA